MQLASCSIGVEGDVPDVAYEFTPEQVKALEETRRKFTKNDLAEIEERQRKGQELIARLAATETLEEQNELADELVPKHDEWIRGRNRVRSVPARRPRLVALIVPRTRAREHRPAATRRTSSSSRTASQDPGSDDSPK